MGPICNVQHGQAVEQQRHEQLQEQQRHEQLQQQQQQRHEH
jgi:hypothetical protein